MTKNQYKCNECGETFKSDRELEQHNRSAHSRFTCEACGQVVNSAGELSAHNRQMHPEQEKTPQR
jgi:DNA-directed RNA polymerase subunit RPC12/RpoP